MSGQRERDEKRHNDNDDALLKFRQRENVSHLNFVPPSRGYGLTGRA
jgi:hypothetical protein